MKTYLLFLLFFSPLYLLQAQTPDCKEFKTGLYRNVENETGNGTEIEIKRTKKFQLEKIPYDGKMIRIKLKITWLNDCTYVLTNHKSNKVAKDILGITTIKNFVLTTTITETESNYYFFEAKSKHNKDLVVKGKMLKLK